MARTSRKRREQGDLRHESFIVHRNARWAWVSLVVCVGAIAAYVWIDVKPRPYGGSPYGYALGAICTLLIGWLSYLGVQKRSVGSGNWTLKGWVSAHVYLGLSLLVLATLHAGLKFDLNVHTVAYALMVIVIVSGMAGVLLYANLPRALSANRGETTQREMVETIHSLDRQLAEAAQPLTGRSASAVRLSLERTVIAGGLFARLTGFRPRSANRRALEQIRRLIARAKPDVESDPKLLEPIRELLSQKELTLNKLRRHVQIRSQLEVWLKIHVPATVALLIAIFVHIYSVFFYW